jgi:pseudaminic acid cytidylyltransferase
MKTVCMIPARSGSKRIPGKNIKDFLGKPIITYPIETAKASGIFDDIIIYSDSDEIRQYSRSLGIPAFFRTTTDNETLTETIIKFSEDYKNFDIGMDDIDYLCVLLPTAVFIDEEIIKDKFLICEDGSWGKIGEWDGGDCMITFCKYNHPIQRAFNYNKLNFKMINPYFEFTRTQDLQESYYDAGQMYFLNVKSFLKQKRIFMDNIYPIIIDAVDIDNPEDWKKAEAFYKVIHE